MLVIYGDGDAWVITQYWSARARFVMHEAIIQSAASRQDMRYCDGSIV